MPDKQRAAAGSRRRNYLEVHCQPCGEYLGHVRLYDDGTYAWFPSSPGKRWVTGYASTTATTATCPQCGKTRDIP
jgi:ribosomal protein S27E